MEFELTEDELILKSVAKSFVDRECPKEYIRRLDEEDRAPMELRDKMAELGWMGLPIPEEYGGSGGDIMGIVLIVEQLAQRGQILCNLYMTSLMFGSESLIRFGSEEQKRFYLPKIASGEVKLSLALTEPDGGTDILGSLKTTAVRDGDSYVINGQKTFISFAQLADYLLTVARTDQHPVKRAEGLSIFIVDRQSPGITMNKIHKLGLKGQDANEVFFNEVRVPEKNLLGELNKGWYHLTNTLNSERICASAMAVGFAQAAFDDALEYAKQRTAFGKPLGQFQVLQHYLVDTAVEIEAARMMTYRAARLSSQKKPCAVESAMAKLLASECAFKAATQGMRILGGVGYTMDMDMQRYLRDSLVLLLTPISNEMTKNLIGQSLGLPRSF